MDRTKNMAPHYSGAPSWLSCEETPLWIFR